MRNRTKTGHRRWRWLAGWTGAVAVVLAAPPALALPGDTLASQIMLPAPLYGVSVAADCQGNVWYTGIAAVGEIPSVLHRMDKTGADLGQVLLHNQGNQAIGMDELAWDEGRKGLWALEHRQNPMKVWFIDPATGLATFQFVASQSSSVGMFRDGIAYDPFDDTLYLSGDVSTTVEHYATNGTFLGQITPKDATGAPLGSISGVAVGLGNVLILGRNPLAPAHTQIFRVTKSGGDFIDVFASGDNRVEGLECDSINFAPLTGLWVRDFGVFPNANSHMDVFEVMPGSCPCVSGGGDDDDDVVLPPFKCGKPIDGLSMIWDGFDVVRVKAWKGAPGSALLGEFLMVMPGQTVSVSGYTGAPNDVIWELFNYISGAKLGESTFHISCSDRDMNGPEDCGKRQGNGKTTSAAWLNDWLFDGMVDKDEVLDCGP